MSEHITEVLKRVMADIENGQRPSYPESEIYILNDVYNPATRISIEMDIWAARGKRIEYIDAGVYGFVVKERLISLSENDHNEYFKKAVSAYSDSNGDRQGWEFLMNKGAWIIGYAKKLAVHDYFMSVVNSIKNDHKQ